MSLSRRVRRAQRSKGRTVAASDAALVLEASGDSVRMRVLPGESESVTRLAMACAQFVRELMEGDDDGETTTGADSASGDGAERASGG